MNKGSGILRTFRTEKLPTPLQLDYHFSVVLDGLLNQISLNESFFRNYYGISSNLGPEKHWKTFYTEKLFRKIGSDRFSHLQKTFQIRRKLFRFFKGQHRLRSCVGGNHFGSSTSGPKTTSTHPLRTDPKSIVRSSPDARSRQSESVKQARSRYSISPLRTDRSG